MNYLHLEILLLEDSKGDAEITLRTLKRRRIATKVEWVRDGTEALDYLFCFAQFSERTKCLPKLIILDFKMPKVDSFQVRKKIKRNPPTRAIPVVMMSSSFEAGDLASSYVSDVNSFLVRPVEFDEFAVTAAQNATYWMSANQTPGQSGHDQ